MAWVLLGFSGYFFVGAYMYSDVNNFRFPDDPEIVDEAGMSKALRLVHLAFRLIAGIACLLAGLRAIL